MAEREDGSPNSNKVLTRRQLLQVALYQGAGLALAACGRAPQPTAAPTQPQPTAAKPEAAPAPSPTAEVVQPQPALAVPPAATIARPTETPQAAPFPTPVATPDKPTPIAILNRFIEKDKAASEFDRRYIDWKKGFISSKGAGGNLRVVVPEKIGVTIDSQNQQFLNTTISEALGYGLIYAAISADKQTFDGLLEYYRQYRQPNGLMPWVIDENGKVLDSTSTTDGDEDIAMALILAFSRWGSPYDNDGKKTINAIMANQVEKGTFVLKPADSWGGSNTVNPSYFSPAYYKIFAKLMREPNWLKVTDSCYTIIGNINQKSDAGKTGLLPNWAKASGEAVPGMDYTYAWDAARAPFRLLMDALWFNDPRAIAQLTKINQFIQKLGPNNIKEGFTLDGKPQGAQPYAVFVAPLTAAAMISPDASYRQAMWNLLQKLPDQPRYYYDPALRLFSLALMGDKLTNPVI